LFAILKIKILWIGLFLAFPPMAAWALRGHDGEPTPPPVAMPNAAETSRVQMPVEVIANGEKPEWVMVEVPAEAIPEPGTALLMMFSSLLLLRRKRKE
jgi:hypothetical protein